MESRLNKTVHDFGVCKEKTNYNAFFKNLSYIAIHRIQPDCNCTVPNLQEPVFTVKLKTPEFPFQIKGDMALITKLLEVVWMDGHKEVITISAQLNRPK